LNDAVDAQEVRQSKTLGPRAKLKAKRIFKEPVNCNNGDRKVYEKLYQTQKQTQSQCDSNTKRKQTKKYQQEIRDQHVKAQLEFLEYLEQNLSKEIIPQQEIEVRFF